MMEWNIQSRAHACQECGRPFLDRQTYHTALFETGPAYERLDLCEACWTARATHTAGRPGFISHWQGVFEVPAPQPDLIRKETAETLLRKLVERADPRYGAAMFILAVMLERKRLLKVKDERQQDGRRLFFYEQPKTGDLFTIVDPGLNLDQLDEVQKDVSALLEHGLPELPTETSGTAPVGEPPSSGENVAAAAAGTVDHEPTAAP